MRRFAALLVLALLAAHPAPCPAGQDLAADFSRHAKAWTAALNAHFLNGPGRPRCIRLSGGDALGRYQAVELDSLETSVVPASRSGAPAVGILRYTETVYASRNATCEAASQGPFRARTSRRVMELFVRTTQGWRPGPAPTGTTP